MLKVFNEISENSLFALATPLYFIWDWMNNIIVDRQIFTFLHNFSGGRAFFAPKKITTTIWLIELNDTVWVITQPSVYDVYTQRVAHLRFTLA